MFDVSQTEGRELPSYGAEELTGNVQNYDAMLKAITKLAPVPVVFSEPDGNARGRYVHSEQRIYLDSGMSQIDTISILIHETAHAILHALPVKDGVVVGVPEKSRRTREVEAESIAYIVCQHFGIETGDSAFVLFFAMGIFSAAASFKELQRPEFALRHFIRFFLAKIAVGYGMEIMTAIFSICGGVAATVMGSIGSAVTETAELPSEIVNAIEDVTFLQSIPLWLVSLLGSLFITVMSFILILTVYGRFFKKPGSL